jgi:isocitrate dehydrogenase
MRDDTDDRVTVDAARASMKYGRWGSMRAITPNAARNRGVRSQETVEQPPTGTFRGMLDGTVFRAPIW